MTAITIAAHAAARPARSLPWRRLLGLLASAAVLAAAWLMFAPTAIGGQTGYVMTSGISMLPHIRMGGLVLVRREAHYHVGEIAAYHNAQLHEVVLHRIVAVHDGHYVFKGDNNDFTDTYQPTAAQIVGAKWIYIPHAGLLMSNLQQPGIFALVIGCVGMISASAWLPARRRRRRHGHR